VNKTTGAEVSMKKAAIVIASIILFVILIGVNYLLWDNSSKKQDIESLENLEETSQQSFQDLWDDYKDANKENMDLKAQITELESVINDKDLDIEQLTNEKMNDFVLVGDKNTIITQLKKHLATEPFEAILSEWVSNINDHAYLAAYLANNEKDIFNERIVISLSPYSEKFANIDFIEITEFKAGVIAAEDNVDQEAKNRISFDVLLNVELHKDEDGFPLNDAIFNNGINHFKVTMAFDMDKWEWFIWTIR